jgi:hypothetical protein
MPKANLGSSVATANPVLFAKVGQGSIVGV